MPTKRRTRLPLLGVLLGLTVLVAGHLWYWYWPRQRVASASSESSAARLVMPATSSDYAFWVPYPHQNLPLAARHMDAVVPAARELAALVDVEVPQLPAWGPFRFPPSRDLALAADGTGDSWVAVATVYPTVRWLFRAAGWLARNPWLAGGDVESTGGRIEVRWIDGVWVAARGTPAAIGQIPGPWRPAPGLGLIRTNVEWGVIPSGLYRVRSRAGDLIVDRLAADGMAVELGSTRMSVPATAAYWAHRKPQGGVSSVAILKQTGTTEARDLPPFAVLEKGPDDRWQLPGERILELLGVDVRTATTGEWQVAVYEEALLTGAQSLASALDDVLASSQGAELVAFGEIDLDEVRRGAEELAGVARRVPILGTHEFRRWRAIANLGRAFQAYDRVSLRSTENPRGFELWLHATGSD